MFERKLLLMASARSNVVPINYAASYPTAGQPTRPMEEFYSLLTKLLQAFYTKDPYGFFYDPVDVSVVTDYSTIIKNPMDLGTMNKKITNQQYATLREFQSDFELICSNCMIYNAPNTVYYKTAQKLLHFGRKLISKEAQKANALLIIAATEESRTGVAGGDKEATDFSTGSLSQLKRKAEVALFKKLHDGSTLFTSLKKYRGPISFSTNPDGSLDLSEYPDLEQVMIHPITEDMTNDKYSDSLTKLSSTGNILANFLTRSQQPKLASSQATPSPSTSMTSGSPYHYYSLDYLHGIPFFSFSPFYDSAGFPIAAFDSAGLSLAYGDPKGRAYIDSLEKFLQSIDSQIELGQSDTNFISKKVESSTTNLLDDLSCDGHSYVKTVYEWRKKIKEQQQYQIQKSTQNTAIESRQGSSLESRPQSPLESKSISERDPDQKTEPTLVDANSMGDSVPTEIDSSLLKQVKSDLNLLARILRWKKVEPEIEKLEKLPTIQFIRQFQHQLQHSTSSKFDSSQSEVSSHLGNPLASSESFSHLELNSSEQRLVRVSKILLQLQSFQNERFKLGNPAAVTQEERDLGNLNFSLLFDR